MSWLFWQSFLKIQIVDPICNCCMSDRILGVMAADISKIGILGVAARKWERMLSGMCLNSGWKFIPNADTRCNLSTMTNQRSLWSTSKWMVLPHSLSVWGEAKREIASAVCHWSLPRKQCSGHLFSGDLMSSRLNALTLPLKGVALENVSTWSAPNTSNGMTINVTSPKRQPVTCMTVDLPLPVLREQKVVLHKQMMYHLKLTVIQLPVEHFESAFANCH